MLPGERANGKIEDEQSADINTTRGDERNPCIEQVVLSFKENAGRRMVVIEPGIAYLIEGIAQNGRLARQAAEYEVG